MQLKDIMTRNVHCLKLGSTLKEAIKYMHKLNKLEGLAIIDEEGEPLGALTKNNVLDALVRGYDLSTKIDSFFNPHVWVVNENMLFKKLLDLIASSPYGLGIAVNNQNKVTGVLSKKDVIGAFYKKADLLIAQINAIYASMHNGIITTDFEGRINTMNPAAEIIFKSTLRSLFGKSFNSISQPLSRLAKEVLATGVPVIAGTVSIFEIPYSHTITPIMSDKKAIGTVIMLQEMKDLESIAGELNTYKKLYHTLETVMNIDYDGLVIVDDSGSITFTNESFQDFIGKPENKLLGSNIRKHIKDCKLEEVANSGIPLKNMVSKHRGRNYIISCIPMKKNDTPFGAVGKVICKDLHEIKILADKIESMSSKLSYYKKELSKRNGSFDKILTENTEMENLIELSRRAAQTDSTVLVIGESGTGKELITQAIHNHSKRAQGPLITINCAAIPENLLETELFGYEEGAFTGAKKQGKPGKFEIANNGTLFLDEIGDMPLSLQAKLLRVIHDKSFERIGGVKTINTDVRIIAASNHDLESMVEDNKFRADLYFRLNVVLLKIPPLRDRISDIYLLASSFIEEYNEILNRNVQEISPEALSIMIKYPWPGNVRELKHTIESIMNFCNDGTVTINDLPDRLLESISKSRNDQENKQFVSKLRNQRDYIEKETIVAALNSNKWNKTKTARKLGISRAWLYQKIKKYGIG